MIETMLRTLLKFTIVLALALPLLANAESRGSRSHPVSTTGVPVDQSASGAPVESARTAPGPSADAAPASTSPTDVNYDDPNMAFSPDYAADSAITCPKTLKGRRLRECLIKNGLAASEEASGSTEILTNTPSTSYH